MIEIGAGIGTMLERLLERDVLGQAEYLVLERERAYREAAAQRHQDWAARHGLDWTRLGPDGWRLEKSGQAISVDWRAASIFDDLLPPGSADLLLAHAFLDLVDLDRALPRMLDLLHSGGLFYFTLNFDGATVFLPEISAALDQAIEREYHASMDGRRDNGLPSGSSRTGRRLLAELPRHGVEMIAAGPSDWIILPRRRAYPPDEAVVLHSLLDMLQDSVGQRGTLDADELSRWIETRRRQIESGELSFLAHQIDVVGRKT